MADCRGVKGARREEADCCGVKGARWEVADCLGKVTVVNERNMISYWKLEHSQSYNDYNTDEMNETGGTCKQNRKATEQSMTVT